MSAPTTRRYRAAAGTPRRRPRVRRASGGLTPVRAAALLAMLISAGAMYGLVATPAFGFDRLEIGGNLLTSSDAIRERVALEPGTNLVGLTTQPIVERLRDLPSVGDATVSVGLPDVLQVTVHERRAIVLWAVGAHRFAVDAQGLLFADVASGGPDDVAALPVVSDQRVGAAGLGIRSVLDPVDLDAATRLGSLTPGAVGSHSGALKVSVTDERGFTLSSGSKGWLAVFGKYGRSQRTPAMIPGQVQLLSALITGREDTIQTVFLGDDKDGTFLAKPTPHASAKPTTKP